MRGGRRRPRGALEPFRYPIRPMPATCSRLRSRSARWDIPLTRRRRSPSEDLRHWPTIPGRTVFHAAMFWARCRCRCRRGVSRPAGTTGGTSSFRTCPPSACSRPATTPLISRIVIYRGFQELGVSLTGERVLLKPNMVEYQAGHSHQHPSARRRRSGRRVRRAGAARSSSAKDPAIGATSSTSWRPRGSTINSATAKVRFVDLNHDDVRRCRCEARSPACARSRSRSSCSGRLRHLDAEAQDAPLGGHDLQHEEPVRRGAGRVYGWPKNLLHLHGIANSILDLVATDPPAARDRRCGHGMEGDGPIMGSRAALGFIGMGSDLVAVDATCARVIGLDPEKISYLKPASHFLGALDDTRIQQRGERLARYAAASTSLPTSSIRAAQVRLSRCTERKLPDDHRHLLAATSRMAQGNFDFLCSPRGVGQGLGDVLGLKVGVYAKNLFPRPPGGDEPDDSPHRHTHASDARLSAHHAGVTSDSRQLWHVGFRT